MWFTIIIPYLLDTDWPETLTRLRGDPDCKQLIETFIKENFHVSGNLNLKNISLMGVRIISEMKGRQLSKDILHIFPSEDQPAEDRPDLLQKYSRESLYEAYLHNAVNTGYNETTAIQLGEQLLDSLMSDKDLLKMVVNDFFKLATRVGKLAFIKFILTDERIQDQILGNGMINHAFVSAATEGQQDVVEFLLTHEKTGHLIIERDIYWAHKVAEKRGHQAVVDILNREKTRRGGSRTCVVS